MGASFVGAVAGAAFSEELFGKTLAAPAGNVLGNLATGFLRGIYVTSRAERNFDIERAMATAIERALADVQREHSSLNAQDDWFTAWRLALSNRSEQNLQMLFGADDAANAVLLAERPDLWWAHFEAALRRWAAAARSSITTLLLEVPDLPAHLADTLRAALPSRTEHYFREAVKAEPRAWVGFQQRFLTHLSSFRAQHEDVARALDGSAKSLDAIQHQLERVEVEFDGLRETFVRFCQHLARRQS